MSSSRGPPGGGSLYGVVELDATLKNTITSLESATEELKKLATLDLNYKMPGLSAFRTDTEQMICMLHAVCNKVEDALNERRNESRMMVNPDMTSFSSTSVGTFSSTSPLTSSSSGTSIPAPAPEPEPESQDVVYNFEVKVKLMK
uniref:Uncharacterized protein n=1 Tax=Panagrolaimus sp. ES5 TaxID=591445 RepID=A0AC34F8I6_9BILA